MIEDMTLLDDKDKILQGLQMIGTIRRRSRRTFAIYLYAGEEEVHVPCVKTTEFASVTELPDHYVVVDDGIVTS